MAWHKSCQEHWQEATSKLTVIHHLTFHQRYRDQHLYKRFMRWNLPKFATAVSIVDIHPAITRSRKPPASPSWLTRWCRRLGVNWRLFSRYSTGFQKRTRTSGSSSSSVLLSSSYKKGKKKTRLLRLRVQRIIIVDSSRGITLHNINIDGLISQRYAEQV